ncbi:hypothetical protein KAH94_00820 [bacterium]|nr:hypothetical protein [bacterium]
MKILLNKKINEWLKTIEDEEIKKVIKENLIITGGCFASFIDSVEPKDFDCYFKTKEATFKVSNYYVDLWNKFHCNKKNKLGKTCEVFVLDGKSPSKKLLDYYKIKNLQESKSRMIANTPEDRIKIIFPSDGIVGNLEKYENEEEVVSEIDEIEAEKIIEKEEKRFFPVFMSTNAITLSQGIQLVVRFYGNPEEIHDTFDYEHCKAYYDFSKKNLQVPKDVYELVVNKVLRYTGSKYPVCSVFRLRKFISRGWKINAGQLLKISMQISQLNLTNIDVLEDQLVGVDSLYFMYLIEQFRKQAEKDENFKLTNDYVMTIVDKIF